MLHARFVYKVSLKKLLAKKESMHAVVYVKLKMATVFAPGCCMKQKILT